jgi:hypothetical protein
VGNRLENFGFDDIQEAPQTPPIKIDLKKNERMMKITLEMADQSGLLDDDLPEGFEGEAFIEEDIFIREREYLTFVKVLQYNRIRYRVETIA